MGTIAATSMGGLGARTVTFTTATASDTFTYKAGVRQIMIIDNVTGGALTPNIDGSGGTTKTVAGLGAAVDVSGGYEFASIASGARVAIELSTISEFCKGTIAMTGADSAEIAILEYE